MARSTGSLYLVTAIFVGVGIVALATTMYMIGKEKNLFQSDYALTASFKNVGGLMVGAPARLAGVDVGRVSGIEFPDRLDDRLVIVHLRIGTWARDRIRGDSLATIGSRGLLGDKVVDITVGSPKSPVLQDGEKLTSEEPADIAEFLTDAQALVQTIKDVAKNLRTVTDRLAQPDSVQAVGDVVQSIRNLIREIETGEGVLHQLVYDAGPPRQIRKTLEAVGNLAVSAQEVAQQLEQASIKVNDILGQAKRGPGLVHGLLYDPKGEALISSLQDTSVELGRAVQQIGTIARDIREGDGPVKRLLYGEEGNNMVADIGQTLTAVRKVAVDVEAGRGTVGGLLRDPTVYEDLKQILGEVKRNKVLKALVRYAADVEDRDRDQQRAPAAPARP